MKLLLYCTKAKPYLWNNKVIKKYMEEQGIEEPSYITSNDLGTGFACDLLNGKIVGECDYEVEEIVSTMRTTLNYVGDFNFKTETLSADELYKKSSLNFDETRDYLSETSSDGYAIHIENLHIFDKSKELSEYYTRINDKDRMSDFKGIDVIFPSVMIDEWLYETVSCKKLEKAPQNMQKIVVFNKETNKYEYAILISIQSQWMCKILNGEKTIEVRKKVLKEML